MPLDRLGLDDLRLRKGLGTAVRAEQPAEPRDGRAELVAVDDLVDHAGLREFLPVNVSVAAAGIYKPDQRVYQLGIDRVGIEMPARCAFVSSNAWDAAGAAQFGLRVFWVDRNRQPVEYQLDQVAATLPDLASLAQHLL